jgi:hypothetical protein
VALAALVLFFLAWDVRAVALDQRITPTDSPLEDALRLVGKGPEDTGGLFRWMKNAKKGLLTPALTVAAYPLAGDWVLASRAVGVGLHGVLLVLLAALARRLTGSWAAALLAVALCGAFRGQFGWFRMDAFEPPLVVLVVLSLWAVWRLPRGLRDAAVLGVLAALGTMAKTVYPLFLAGPAVWLVAKEVRRPRGWARLGVAAGVAAVLLLPWALALAPSLGHYWQSSTQYASEPPDVKLLAYATDMPGALAALLLGLVGGPVAWRLRAAPPRALGVMGLSAGLSLVPLVTVFDPWARYYLPGYVVCTFLGALGLYGLARWLGRRVRPAAVAVLLGVLVVARLGHFVSVNLEPPPEGDYRREAGAGMVVPDPRPSDALPRAASLMRDVVGEKALLLDLDMFRNACPEEQVALWRDRGEEVPRLSEEEAMEVIQEGEPLYVVLCHCGDEHPSDALDRVGPDPNLSEEMYRALEGLGRKRLATFRQHDGLCMSVFRLR